MIHDPSAPPIVHHIERRRFELSESGATAMLEYTLVGNGDIWFEHTHVPVMLRGQGAGAALVRAALLKARELGWRVIPRCAFVADYVQRHPEFADVIHFDRPTASSLATK